MASTKPVVTPIIEHVTNVPRPFESLRPHFSFSQLGMYLRCSMQYYFRYVLGLKERPNLNLTRGKAGHTALELNARYKIANQADKPVEEILDIFSDAFGKGLTQLEPGDLAADDNPGREKDNTIETLRLWRLRDAAKITPHAVELEFLIPIPMTEDHHDEVKPINGKIDLVSTRPVIMTPRGRPVQKLSVEDAKFPSRAPANPLEVALLSDQLTLYDYVLTQAGKAPQVIGLEHFIPPTKTKPARVEFSPRSPAAMKPGPRAARHARLLYKLRTAARGIKAGIFLPTDDPKDCSWCGFRTRCQDSLVKSDYEAMMIRANTSRDPLGDSPY